MMQRKTRVNLIAFPRFSLPHRFLSLPIFLSPIFLSNVLSPIFSLVFPPAFPPGVCSIMSFVAASTAACHRAGPKRSWYGLREWAKMIPRELLTIAPLPC